MDAKECFNETLENKDFSWGLISDEPSDLAGMHRRAPNLDVLKEYVEQPDNEAVFAEVRYGDPVRVMLYDGESWTVDEIEDALRFESGEIVHSTSGGGQFEAYAVKASQDIEESLEAEDLDRWYSPMDIGSL